MGWKVEEVQQAVLTSEVGRIFRSMLFQRIVPNLKKLHLHLDTRPGDRVHPEVVAVMQEEGIDLDLSSARPRGEIARTGKNSPSIDSRSSCSQAFSAAPDLLYRRMAARAGSILNGGL